MVYLILFSIISFVFGYYNQKEEILLPKKIVSFLLGTIISIIPSALLIGIVIVITSFIFPTNTIHKAEEYSLLPMGQQADQKIYARPFIENSEVNYTLLAGTNENYETIESEANSLLFIKSDQVTLERYEVDYSDSVRFWLWGSPHSYEIYKVYLPQIPYVSPDFHIISK